VTVFASLAFFTSAAPAQDALRIEELRQDIAELRRLIREQSRRIDNLERLARMPDAPDAARRTREGVPLTLPPGSDKWLSSRNWDRVKPGMKELEVLDILGYPTSVREGTKGKTLFYTVPIGESGFLSGRVIIAGEEVREVEKPTLR